MTAIPYNSLLVFLGTSVLGFAGGLVGSFMLLRRRALLGDVISHAMLPGIALIMLLFATGVLDGLEEFRFSIVFGAGALSGGAGLVLFYLVRNFTRLKDDVALSLSLSVFFGFGIVLLSFLQQVGGLYASGVEGYLYGKAASLIRQDVIYGIILTIIVTLLIAVFFRIFVLISFDSAFARCKGYAVGFYDTVLFTLILAVCMVGLQAVGIMLMLALLIIPPSSMRFWTGRLVPSVWGAAILGAFSGFTGSVISAYYADIPSGPSIVLSSCLFFLVSVLFGSHQGILWRLISHRRFIKKMDREHLLRHWFEFLEDKAERHLELSDIDQMPLTQEELSNLSISKGYSALSAVITYLQRAGLIRQIPGGSYFFTRQGFVEAERLVHQHRLWELFLVKYADIAPSMVDRGADRIEHVLESHIIRELEDLLIKEGGCTSLPKSPHPI